MYAAGGDGKLGRLISRDGMIAAVSFVVKFPKEKSIPWLQSKNPSTSMCR
jgi:hypothetical protein